MHLLKVWEVCMATIADSITIYTSNHTEGMLIPIDNKEIAVTCKFISFVCISLIETSICIAYYIIACKQN